MLMTLMSALHNISRGLGCALLIVSGGKMMAALFIGGEILLFLVYTVIR